MAKPPAAAHLEDVRAALDIEFNQRSDHGHYWTWYRDFESPLSDWNLSMVPWVCIADGDMARMIFSTVEQIQQSLQRVGLQTRLAVGAPRT